MIIALIGVGGTVIGTLFGAGLNARSQNQIRAEERILARQDAQQAARAEAGQRLDEALTDSLGLAVAEFDKLNAPAGLEAAAKRLGAAVAFDAHRLRNRTAETRLRALTTFLDASQVIAPPAPEIAWDLLAALRRGIADGRATLDALTREAELPEDGFPSSDEMAGLLRVEKPGALPEAMPQWLETHPPNAQVEEFLQRQQRTAQEPDHG